MMNIRKQHRLNKGKTIILGLGTALALGNTTQAKFDGFYAGAGVGYLNQNTDIKADQNPTDQNADAYNSTAGRGSPTVELFFGWGKVFNACFYGGVEGKVDFVTGGVKKVAEGTRRVTRLLAVGIDGRREQRIHRRPRRNRSPGSAHFSLLPISG